MASTAFLITCMFMLAAGLKADDEFPKDGEVLVLTDENFDKALERYKNVLVLFYLENCGYYHRMVDRYHEAAKRLAAEGSSIKLAKAVLSENLVNIRIRYWLTASPSLRYFRNKQISDYRGTYETESIISFVKAHAV